MCIQAPTCGTGGFQRMFLSGAGVKPVVLEGLFFRSRITPFGSSRSLTTRFFSCQPTLYTQNSECSLSMVCAQIDTMHGQICRFIPLFGG